MTPWQFVKMAKWAHRPPALWRVKLVFGVVIAALLLVAVERWIGWPDWAEVSPTRSWRSLR